MVLLKCCTQYVSKFGKLSSGQRLLLLEEERTSSGRLPQPAAVFWVQTGIHTPWYKQVPVNPVPKCILSMGTGSTIRHMLRLEIQTLVTSWCSGSPAY